MSESNTDKTGNLTQESASDKNPAKLLTLPSPIITRRTRTDSTSARAFENPQEKGKVKLFSRQKGHGFITSNATGEDIFVHISDIEGEYVPLPGDEVEYRLCPIPPKYEKYQAVHVNIVNLTPEVHIKCSAFNPLHHLEFQGKSEKHKCPDCAEKLLKIEDHYMQCNSRYSHHI